MWSSPSRSYGVRRRSSSGSRGQAAVLSALALFSMVIFLAMASNTGILVNDRIRMQSAADLSSYAGALEQARTMNEIATLNKRIYNHVQRVRGVLNYGPAYVSSDPPDSADVFYWRQDPCSCLDYSPQAQAYIKASQAAIDVQTTIVRAINVKGQMTSKAAAWNTARRNFLGPNSSPRHVSFFANTSGSPTASMGVVPLIQVDDTIVGYNYIRSCRCCDGCCMYPQIHTETMSTWFYKDGEKKVYFPVKLKGVPEKNFIDFGRGSDSYFGAQGSDDSDMLYGYAAAKPYEGIIGTSNPDNDNIGGSMTPQNPVYPPSTQYEDYFHSTYRARMAGMQENMGTGSKPARMTDLVKADATEPQFQSKTQYFTH